MSDGRPHWMRCSLELRRAGACRHTWAAVVHATAARAAVTGKRYRIELGPRGWRSVELTSEGRPACSSR